MSTRPIDTRTVLNTGPLVLAAILVVAALILVNAVYVAAEFAAVSVRRSRIQQLAEDGNPPRRAGCCRSSRSPAALDRYIAACQIGITVSGLVLGAYAKHASPDALAPLLGACGGLQPSTAQSTSIGIVLLLLTVAQVIFAELVPKSLALQYPTQAALYALVPMAPSMWVYRPFITWLNGTGLVLRRLLGAPPKAHRHIHSPEEIELLIAESRDGGLLEPDEHRRLQRALRLNLRQAKQLMVPRPGDLGDRHQHAAQRGDSARRAEPVLAPAGLSRLDRQHRRHAAHQGPRALAGERQAERHARRRHPADRERPRERDRRSRAAPPARAPHAPGARRGRVRRHVRADHARRRAVGAARRRRRRVQGRRAGRRRRCPTAASGCRARCRSRTRRRSSDTTWETEAATVDGFVTEALGHLPTPRERVVIGDFEFEVEGVADARARDRCSRGASGNQPIDDEDAGVSAILVTARRHPPARRWRTGCSSPRSSRSSARRAPASSTGRAGQPLRPARRRASSTTARRRDRYIATTQIGVSLASLGLGMYGEHVVAEWIAAWLEPVQHRRVDRRAHGGERRRHRAPDLPAHRPRRDGAEGAGAAGRDAHGAVGVAARSRASQTPLLPLVVALNGIGNAVLRAVGVQRRTSPKKSGITRTEELQLIIQESQEGGLLRGESGRILRELFEFGDLTAGQVMVPRVHLVGIPVGTDGRRAARDRPDAAAHPVSRLHRRPRQHRRQRSHQGSAAASRLGSAGHRARRPSAAVRSGDDAARRGAGGDAARPRADGGGHGRARRHRRHRHDRGSVRGGRRRDRRRPRPHADLARGVRPAARARHGPAEGRRRCARPVARASGGADDQRPRAGAARPSRRGRRCGDVERRADRGDGGRGTRRAEAALTSRCDRPNHACRSNTSRSDR